MTNSHKKGFTLIEILIASTIFAIIMIMATAVFSMTSSYNAKIRETRNSLSEARGTMMKISDDVRLSNGSVKITAGTTADVLVRDVFLVQTDQSGSFSTTSGNIVRPGGTNPDETINYNSNNYYSLGVLKKTDSKIILYRTLVTASGDHDLYRREYTISDEVSSNEWKGTINLNTNQNFREEIVNNEVSLNARFWGFMASSGIQQPFVRIGIFAQSKDYDNLLPNYRAQAEIKTSVESRDYNP
ncbi:MAG: prepilin-type N-terminal cleavage/methylation domain-containing protein [Patescibacteria group bacterium]|jgi:prepilin-type N-terminal cleavage/methylation domain-containing protein